MANSHGIVTQAITTSTPDVTQNFTQASLGTPKAYLFWGTESQAVNNNYDDYSVCFGASDLAAVDGFLAYNNYEDDQATSDVQTDIRDDGIYQGNTPGTNDGTELADHNATVTDGIQVNFTATSAAKLATAILLKEGIDSVDVQTPSINGTGSTTITTGHAADVVLIYAPSRDTLNTSANTFNGGLTFYDVATDTYASYFVTANHGDTTPDSAERYDESVAGGSLGVSSGTMTNSVTLGTFTATGFDVTKVSGTAGQYLLIISIKLSSGYSAAVGTATAPTSTGVTSLITGLDHTPQIAMFLGCLETAVGGSITQCAFYQGACTEDDMVATGGAIEDSGGGTQNTQAVSYHRTDSCIYITDDAHTQIISKAEFDSFQTDGVDLNFLTAVNAVKIGYLTIGPNIGGGELPGRHGAGRGIGRGIARGIG